jgi:hypothetical protein
MGFKLRMKTTDDQALANAELPKQAKEVLAFIIGTYGDAEFDNKDLNETIDANWENEASPKIFSKQPVQPPSRIFAFYRKRFADENYMEVTKTTAPKKEPSADDGEPKPKRSRRKKADAEQASAADEAALS